MEISIDASFGEYRPETHYCEDGDDFFIGSKLEWVCIMANRAGNVEACGTVTNRLRIVEQGRVDRSREPISVTAETSRTRGILERR
jgi:hypothetical protein